VLLIGGNGYTSSTSYMALLYRQLPFEMWTYATDRNEWELIQNADGELPKPDPVRELAAAVNDQDEVILVTTRRGSQAPPTTWSCTVSASKPDAAATAKQGVRPGTLEYRTGPYDPAWYHQDLPSADPSATTAILKKLPVNQWTALKCPRWPFNRMGGGWSTVAFDPDRDQILHLGGGHSSYFGNDVAHYDIATGRWSIACRPQFALNYNYDLSGPGPWAFNNAPWGNHNYRAYAYDPTCKRLVYMRAPTHTMLYDPDQRTWPIAEQVQAPWPISKYTTVLCPTPRGMVAWVQNPGPSAMRLFLLEKGQKWTALPLQGDALPTTVTDGSTLTYDSRRDQLIMTTTPSKEPMGQVWTCDLKTGTVTMRHPAGMNTIKGQRFAREAVYLPGLDLVMFGYLMEGAIPFYEVSGNRWLTAKLPGSDFFARGATCASVDLGLAYDRKRDLVWAVLCHLKEGAINVFRPDGQQLKLTPLK
jgi:hypothetical protein